MNCAWVDFDYRSNNKAIRIALSSSGDVAVFMQSIRNRTIQELLSNLHKNQAIVQGSIVKVVKLV